MTLFAFIVKENIQRQVRRISGLSAQNVIIGHMKVVQVGF